MKVANKICWPDCLYGFQQLTRYQFCAIIYDNLFYSFAIIALPIWKLAPRKIQFLVLEKTKIAISIIANVSFHWCVLLLCKHKLDACYARANSFSSDVREEKI